MRVDNYVPGPPCFSILQVMYKARQVPENGATMMLEMYCLDIAVAAPPVWLVLLWPDHFSSRPDYNIAGGLAVKAFDC